MTHFRWMLVLLVAPLGYLAAIVLAILLTQMLQRFCPVDAQVSGVCMLPWYPAAEMVAFSMATSIGASLWVVLPVLVAPAHKVRVAWLAYAAGAAFAIVLAIQGGDLWVPLASALLVGAAVAAFLDRCWPDRRNGREDGRT